jgi:redox-sensitive bicupin YhaK (pirin superfamily)
METAVRNIAKIIEPQPVVEGAGVRLKRSIGTRTLDHLDPFLLLDDFTSKNTAEYQAGFPLHPHRGIETVTYLLAGAVRHKDTLGNAGEIGAGEVQWMTAGRGIMHEEMPQVRPEGIAGFQLWVNLPAKLKMTAPRYQNISANEIPEIRRDRGAKIRAIAGTVDAVSSPPRAGAAPTFTLKVSGPILTTPLEAAQPDRKARMNSSPTILFICVPPSRRNPRRIFGQNSGDIISNFTAH